MTLNFDFSRIQKENQHKRIVLLKKIYKESIVAIVRPIIRKVLQYPENIDT